jgi:hypothetical protein
MMFFFNQWLSFFLGRKKANGVLYEESITLLIRAPLTDRVKVVGA